MAATAALVPRVHRTVQNELQEYCDALLDDAIGVTWDLYRLNQKDQLDLKVRWALFPESVYVDEQTGRVSIIRMSILFNCWISVWSDGQMLICIFLLTTFSIDRPGS